MIDHTGKVGFTYNGETYLYRKNVQGDDIAIIDSNGNGMVKYAYDAWGNHTMEVVPGENAAQNKAIGNLNPIRYRSYYFDTDSGMYWLTTRFYGTELQTVPS